ncbi:MAG: glycosyltransferase [Verrucomicrobiota bacterium]|nr:glycosyltransferase [Verrucomicrobiota bacterium]
MKILLVCTRPVVGGNLTYLCELTKRIAADNRVDLHIAIHANIFNYLFDEANVTAYKLYNKFGHIGEGYAVKKVEDTVRPDVVHFTNTLPPFFYMTKARLVCTIHDLNFLTVSQGFFKNLYKKLSYKISRNKINGILFVSNYTRQVFNRYIPELLVSEKVVHEASKFKTIECNQVGELCKENYVVAFAHRNHKNPQAAYEIVRLYNELFLDDMRILFVGRLALKQSISSGELLEDALKNDNIRYDIIEGVSDEALQGVYQKASALIFLSNYEGFGLPVLESLGNGCPVITHRKCSIPEVAGHAALYIVDNKNGYHEAAKYLWNLNHDKKLYKNEILKGLTQASKFSWEEVADNTVKFYLQLCDS